MAGASSPQLHLVDSPPVIDPGSDMELVDRAKESRGIRRALPAIRRCRLPLLLSPARCPPRGR